MSVYTKVLIIGTGPAGYTAAIYAARAGLYPIIVSGLEVGGQLMNTVEVENWPGEQGGTTGPELMLRMDKHTKEFVPEITNDHIVSIDFDSKPFLVSGEKNEYQAESIIIATGSTARYLNLPDENKLRGRGLSACATCDGFFFKRQDVAVIGGGNTAVEEALYLSNIARRVFLIHRRDQLRAEKILQDRLMAKVREGKIDILWNTEVKNYIEYQGAFKGLALINKADDILFDLPISGCFMAIGHTPNTEFLQNRLKLNGGYIIVNGKYQNFETMTSIPGIFAAGDVADNKYRQAITSAGSGCMAALDAEKWLQLNNI
ncbi:thioredoxin reductase [Xenorhabdus vietnamensis]|uniref:Thioredoxin reductase n=1 Tax=Xenorhabdus vietnamensis TaxID=351656 RepID=A0A1Y2SHI1_9GAMM|nr:thioredoxin-disulfide reductase [Xenorhabdus vietnamensis]OTA18280.1 thioredoxin reductase [Xenorhabdus vietnamensis]